MLGKASSPRLERPLGVVAIGIELVDPPRRQASESPDDAPHEPGPKPVE
ncbi:hypothetical protein ACFPN7_29985 [Amycolatopsis halotolerans]